MMKNNKTSLDKHLKIQGELYLKLDKLLHEKFTDNYKRTFTAFVKSSFFFDCLMFRLDCSAHILILIDHFEKYFRWEKQTYKYAKDHEELNTLLEKYFIICRNLIELKYPGYLFLCPPSAIHLNPYENN